MVNKLCVGLLIAMLSCTGLIAQEGNKSEPLELPNFIIDGDVKLSVKSGIKEFPSKIRPMTARELDSLNSLQKQQSLLLPPEPLPRRILTQGYPRGWVRGSFGRFTNAKLDAAYTLDVTEYANAYANINMDSYGGHVKNSDYMSLNVLASSDYIADKKYWIFGGSKTRTSLNINNNSYHLYSIADAPDRNVFSIGAAVDVDGNYNGYLFTTGASLDILSMSQTNNNMDESAIAGYLSVTRALSSYELGANVEIDMRTLRGDAVNFMQANAFTKIPLGDILLMLDAGLQAANNSMDDSRGGLLVSGSLQYALNQDFTIKASLASGLKNVRYSGLLDANPYLLNDAELDFQYEMPAIRATVLYHPDDQISASAHMNISSTDHTPIYSDNGDGSFILIYDEVNLVEFGAECSWDMTEEDMLSGSLMFRYSTMAGNSNITPYTAPYIIGMDYRKKWTEEFGTQIGVDYVGSRYFDIENDRSADAYPFISISADYRIIKNLKAFANFENLTNSSIFIFEGYEEKGIYISAGILWQF